ncbi:zf-CCHC domain-containing protein [Tanacetum coccineum]
MDSNFNNENDPWECSLDIDDSDLYLTPVLRPSSSTRVEPSPSTPNPVRIIPGHAGIIQQAKLLKEKVFIIDSDGALILTQEYMQKVVEDVGEDDDFKSGSWVSATNYVNANGGTSCSPIVLGDLAVTIKDLSGTIPGTIHQKVIGEGGYGKDITVGVALILASVSVFTPKPSMHYLNITKKNMVKVFHKDTVPANDSD